MTRSEADILEWKKHWITTKKREFTTGEVHTELGVAINTALRSLGAGEIPIPRKGKITVLVILNLIPEENYNNVIGRLPPTSQASAGPTTVFLVNLTLNLTQNLNLTQSLTQTLILIL